MEDTKACEIEEGEQTPASMKNEDLNLNVNYATENKEVSDTVRLLAEDAKQLYESNEIAQTERSQIQQFENDISNINNSDSFSKSQISTEKESPAREKSQILSKPTGEYIITNKCDHNINSGESMAHVLEMSQNIDSCKQQLENAEASIEMTDVLLRKQINFTTTPVQVTGSWRDFEGFSENFLKGCKWSPDGSCILTCSEDNMLRLFNLPIELYSDDISSDILPEMSSVLGMKEGETVYDYSWYPNMSSYEPATCCFISSSRDHPLHLWDAFTGKIRCSYRAYNHMDEIISPHSVAFNLDGSKIYCGFNKTVRVFDTSRPGRQCQQRPTVSKKQGQFGIISCIAISPENNGLYACGSFSKSVGIYGEPKGKLMSLIEGHHGGVTHLVFSQDGHRLYSGGRKDNEIICWDMRFPGAILHRLLRSVKTNQRMYFDIDSSGKYIFSGNHDGTISVWDTCVSSQVESDVILPSHLTYIAHDDCVNGVNFHPSLPLLATASGQRTFIIQDECENDENQDELTKSDNSLRLWKINCNSEINE